MTILKPNELADLRTMAQSNLDVALLSAARLGMGMNNDVGNTIKRASLIIDYEADTRKDRMMTSKQWDGDTEVKKVYAEYKHIVKKLRALLECLN